jgi:hypothetical protein
MACQGVMLFCPAKKKVTVEIFLRPAPKPACAKKYNRSPLYKP